MIDPKETELEFDAFFEQLGYLRPSAEFEEAPGFKNADYVHARDGIIVELKVLDKDHFVNGGIVDSINALILQPDSINDDGLGLYTFSLPEINREGKHDTFEEPLRRALKTANRQIRETKQFCFGTEPIAGFVVLAQTGFS